ncbi:MAG: hypothetical protein ACLRSW_16025 [Christensenellaceae bacterium]
MSNLSFGAGYWKKQLPLTVLSYLSSFIAIVTICRRFDGVLDYAVCYDPQKPYPTGYSVFSLRGNTGRWAL